MPRSRSKRVGRRRTRHIRHRARRTRVGRGKRMRRRRVSQRWRGRGGMNLSSSSKFPRKNPEIGPPKENKARTEKLRCTALKEKQTYFKKLLNDKEITCIPTGAVSPLTFDDIYDEQKMQAKIAAINLNRNRSAAATP